MTRPPAEAAAGPGADPSPEPGLKTRVHVLGQYLVPQLLLSGLMHRFARVGWRPLKDRQIAWFQRRYGIDLSEAVYPDPRAYPHLNAFFTRALRPGARPLPDDAGGVVAPADGVVSAFGRADGDTLIQAKGQAYSLADLLGDPAHAAPFPGGSYLTVYLSPRDYHRVHMPAAGQLRAMHYLPGRLFSVNRETSRLVPRLFVRNERVVAHFDTDLGPMAVVLVGALLVGGIETVWAGAVTPPHGRTPFRQDYGETAIRLARGEELGRFNMGSTVIVLFPPDRIAWNPTLAVGTRVRMGADLAHPVRRADVAPA
jgi:phosphatidylserine decarboxylase